MQDSDPLSEETLRQISRHIKQQIPTDGDDKEGIK